MRLIEATERGCRIYPHQLFRGFQDDDAKAACWLGAVYAGFGLEQGDVSLSSRLPFMMQFSYCPECNDIPGSLTNLGLHLNDAHEWTRESISLYLSQYEPESLPESQPEEVAVG